ncbi:MAG TPA: DUF1569 domain-containing protein [Chryseolinea sp.]|nr:DUF1569 domain-containing protein [Chryseolinea sp.]
METSTKDPFSIELPEIKEASKETIFNPANLRAIHDRIVDIKPDAQRQWGKMNLVQMLNHLKVATGSAIKIYNLQDESNFLYRTIIKFIVLRVLKRLPKSAAAPQGFKIEMNNALDFGTEKEQLLNILRKTYRSPYESYPHPLFGMMSREEWGRLVYRHFDHHLRQFSS